MVVELLFVCTLPGTVNQSLSFTGLQICCKLSREWVDIPQMAKEVRHLLIVQFSPLFLTIICRKLRILRCFNRRRRWNWLDFPQLSEGKYLVGERSNNSGCSNPTLQLFVHEKNERPTVGKRGRFARGPPSSFTLFASVNS